MEAVGIIWAAVDGAAVAAAAAAVPSAVREGVACPYGQTVAVVAVEEGH